MKNIGITKCMRRTVDDFTTDFGIKARRVIDAVLRPILRLATKRKIVVESYPKLEKGKPYIFASTHHFDEDIIANLAIIDRNAWLLTGATHQVEYNPQFYAAWLHGMVYVDRRDDASRKESVKKMECLLKAGTSVVVYPEGGWNNTENLLIQKLFAGPYILSEKLKIPVVPLSLFHEVGSDTIYYRAGEPLNLFEYEKHEALGLLRDTLGTMMFEQIKKHSTPIDRKKLTGDIHMKYMEERKNEYLRVKWRWDMWDDELTVYKDKDHPLPADAWSFVDNVKITTKNAHIFAPLLVLREEHKKYDFKQYMHENWDK